MSRTLSAERWLELTARGGVLTAEQYGFTHRPETRVFGWRVLPFHIFYLCLDGGFKVSFEAQTVELKKGSFLWMMPNIQNETQLLAKRKSFRTYYFRFTLAEEDGITPVRLEPDIVVRHDALHTLPYFRDLVNELQSPQQFHDQRVRGSLMMLSAAALGEQVPREQVTLTAQQRLRLNAFLDIHIDKATPQDLADEVGLSMPYFRRLFQRSYGMSPMRWIVHQRVMMGAIMLTETELTAKEVAYRLGYRDRHLFSRQFKQIMGVSARPFRRGNGAEPQIHHMSDQHISPILRTALSAKRPRTRWTEI